MPSSPDTLAVRWNPEDLATLRECRPEPAAAPTPRAVGLFEVSPTSGVPEALLSSARSAAEKVGYLDGWNRGHSAALKDAEVQAHRRRLEAEQQTAAVLTQLGHAGEALLAAGRSAGRRAIESAADIEDLIVASAFRIAESLVAAALADDAVRGRAAVARALALAPENHPLQVCVSPADHALLVDTVDLGPDATLVADPDLAPGDSYTRTGATTIDARISTGLERVRRLLDQDAP